MSFYKEVPGRKTTLESTLKFDLEPTAGSTNPVTSDGVNSAIDGAVGDASEALQEQIDDIAEKAGSGYTPKGPASVATLNALSGQENGELYTMTDAGTLTDGSLAVVAGDTVAWDATNSVWYKAMDYAPSQYGTNEVKNLPTTITNFRTGDVMPVDGPSGTAKMAKDDLLRVTAQNALTKILPAFDPNKSTDPETGFAYKAGESVIYNGEVKMFIKGHTGAWANADAVTIQLPQTFATSEVMQRLLGNRLDDSQFILGREIGLNGAVGNGKNRGDSGLCPCLPGETLYIWREGETNPNQFNNYISFFDINKNYLSGYINADTVRKQVVPANAYYFSIPIKWADGVPQKTVVANYLPSGFVLYATSSEKTARTVVSANCPKNVFDPSAVTTGKYISAVSNGEEVWTTDTGIGMTDYIDVRKRMLFCFYDYSNLGNKWPFIYYVTYDSEKNPIRRVGVGDGRPIALSLNAGEDFVRIQFTASRINDISFGYEKFNSYVPFGYEPVCLLTKDVANEAGDSTVKPISQKAATELFNDAGAEPTDFALDITGLSTDILCVSRNYILKEYEENSTRYFEFSDDCGKTFTKVENTIGQVNFVHFFSTGRVLICGAKKCYYTDDFSEFTETAVYDYDGSLFDPEANHFYRLGNYNSEYNELNGNEVLVWNDYNVEAGYKSRVWFTDDYGVTLKCILKDEETLDSDGNVINVTHFHRTWLENDTGKLWVTSGDEGDLCKLLCGHIENGDWVWDLINKGALYKLSQFVVRRPYAYFVTDYTNVQNPTGIACCPINGIADPTNFRYLYKTANNEALSKYFEDESGYRVILPDGVGYKKMWFANGNFDFKQAEIVGAGNTIVLDNIYGPDYHGNVICLSHTNGYGVATNPSMNLYPRYDFGRAMRKAGFKKFGRIINLIK